MRNINPQLREKYSRQLYPYLVGKGKGRVSWNLLILIVFTFVGFPLLTIKIFATILQRDKVNSQQVVSSADVTPLVYYMYQTMQAFSPTPDFVTSTLEILPTSTMTVTPTFIPTVNHELFQRPTPVMYNFRLSFYDPAIGSYFPDKAEINCLNWDAVEKKCNSKLLGGIEDYGRWYRRGLACPAEFPFYTTFEVVDPPQLAGVWTCVDRGGLIVDDWLDFLLRYPDQIWTGYDLDEFPWGSTVSAYVTYPE